MPNPTRLFPFFFILIALFSGITPLAAEPATPTHVPTQVPIPTITPKGQSYTKALIVHKPMPDPAWGKVIQYRWEETVDPSTKAKETIYEFVFQNENNEIRVCKYHEDDNGEGYWEVYLWDLP